MTLAQFDRLSEAERGYWIADWQLAKLECPDCGGPVEKCSDPNGKHYPFRRVCYATMERLAADAMYVALHEDRPFHDGTFTSWAKERSRSHPYGAMEGVTIGVADEDIAPWDHFTTRENASLLRPEKSPDHQDKAASTGE